MNLTLLCSIGLLMNADPVATTEPDIQARIEAWFETEDPKEQEALAREIIDRGKEAAPILAESLADAAKVGLLRRIRLLIRIGDPETGEAVLAGVERLDPLPLSVLRSLGNLRTEKVETFLVGIVRNGKGDQPKAAAASLQHFQGEQTIQVLVDTLDSEGWALRSQCLASLAAVHKKLEDRETIRAVVKKGIETGETQRVIALMKFIQLVKEEGMAESVYGLLQSNQTAIAMEAIETLEFLQDTGASQRLIMLLRHRDEKLRARAAEAIGKVARRGDPATLQELVRHMKADRSPVARAGFARGLTQLTGKKLGENPVRWQRWMEAKK